VSGGKADDSPSRGPRVLPSPAWLKSYLKLHPLLGKQGPEGHVRRCPKLRGPTIRR